MIPELGHFALILALLVAATQGIVPMLGAALNRQRMMALARPAARMQFVLVAIAFACLAWSFASNDFSVQNVASNSNSELPLHYRIEASWGLHEGSLLLWALMLTGWSCAVSVFSRNLPDALAARVLSVMGLISVGFLLFLLFTSNPFARLIPPAPEGRDLNPLLQDPGMVFHPPLLYMGYVGFSVAFAFALAALIGGRLDATWALVATLDDGRVGIPDDRDRAGQRVGLLHARLGRMVVLGPGRERVVHAVAHRHSADPFASRDREARRVPQLDGAARTRLSRRCSDFPGPLRRAHLARLRDRWRAACSSLPFWQSSSAARLRCSPGAPAASGSAARSRWFRASRCCSPTTSCWSSQWRACCSERSIRCSSTHSTWARFRSGRRISTRCSTRCWRQPSS
jgi:hypothetical protein